MPALGVLYIGSLFRKEGLDVNILDSEGQKLAIKSTADEIIKRGTKILGITTTTLSIHSAVSVASEVKARDPEIKVFLGGPHVTAVPEETMEKFGDIDGCIIGDGELSFLRTVKNILSVKKYSDGVDGLVWRDEDKICSNPKTFHLNDVDMLPFPAWDMLEGFPSIYRPPFHSYRRLPVANIITARGCPYGCSFCDRSVFGRKVIRHSIEYVINMIEKLVLDFGIREISIKDDTFVMSEERVMNFCKQIRQRGLDLTWSCNARVNFINEKLLREMKNAGCWMISYGIESGSDRILEKMNKQITKEAVLKALKITRKVGIVSKGFFMIGVPGETKDTIQETVEFVRGVELDEMNVNFFTPFPGSKLFDEVVEEGFEVDYSRMNMLEPVYVTKELTKKVLYKYQKKIIYSFYLRLSKLLVLGLRAMGNIDEFKRLARMARMFLALAFK